MNRNTIAVLSKHFLSVSGYKCPKIVGEKKLRKLNWESLNYSFHLMVWSKIPVWVPFSSWYNAEFRNSGDGENRVVRCWV